MKKSKLNKLFFCNVCRREENCRLFFSPKTKDFEYFECISCGTIYNTVKLNESQYIEIDYHDNYELIQKDLVYKSYYELLRLKNSYNINKGKILDFGGSTGVTLVAAKHLGFECYLCELNKKARGIARNVNGIEKQYCDINEINQGKEKFDIIYSSHTLEHVNNPIEVLGSFKNILKPNGIIVLIVPFLDSYKNILKYFPYRNKGNMGIYLGIGHNFLWTKSSLSKLVNNEGFKIVGIKASFIGRKIYPFKNLESRLIMPLFFLYSFVFNILFMLNISTSMTFILKKNEI